MASVDLDLFRDSVPIVVMAPVPISPTAHLFGHRLDDEVSRMQREWFHPWRRLQQGMEVDKFDGGKIALSGVRFGQSDAAVYWAALDRYLTRRVTEYFSEIAGIVIHEPIDPLRELEWLTVRMEGFVNQIAKEAADTYVRVSDQVGADRPREAHRLFNESKANVRRLAKAIQLRSTTPKIGF